MEDIKRDIDMAKRLALAVSEKGGRAYFVGGYVRDLVRGGRLKDIDIEVHGIDRDSLFELLSHLGEVTEYGKSFGILGIAGYGIDIALPRGEKAVGSGHRDFEISLDENMGTYNACLRRDFTVNALMQDILTGEITDHFGGLGDLKNGILRHVNSQSFAEDPLRVLRGAQFTSRFNMKISEDTKELFGGIDISVLSRERVMEELLKALLGSDKPSVFFEVLRETDKLGDWFPELSALIGIEQNPVYHSEGDAWTHTMMVLDEAVKFKSRAEIERGFMLSALCHDFGKAVSTVVIDGVIHAYNHETEGLPLIERFMKRLTNENKLIGYVLNMCRYHMKPRVLAGAKSSFKSTNKLFDASVDPMGLIYLSEADSQGKIPKGDPKQLDFLLERLDVYTELMKEPHVTGADLIARGLKEGGELGEALKYAHKLRLAMVPREEAIKQVLGSTRLKVKGNKE